MYFLHKIHQNKIARYAIHLYTYIEAKRIFPYSPKRKQGAIPVYLCTYSTLYSRRDSRLFNIFYYCVL